MTRRTGLAWDGGMHAQDINPYRYIPADPALAALRDRTVYPPINRKEYARTTYPPVAEMVFGIAGRLWDDLAGLPPKRILHCRTSACAR